MKKKLLTNLVVGLVLGVGYSANASIINFSDLSNDGTAFTFLGKSVIVEGFKFTSSFNSSLGVWQNSSTNHPIGGHLSTSLVEYYAGATTTMTEVNNNLFTLTSIDLAPWGVGQHGMKDIKFIGTKFDSSTVQQIFSVNFTDGLTPSLQHFSFNNFTDIVQVSFTQGPYHTNQAYQFNNLSVNPVPVPGAVWLLGSGIAGFVALRKRKK